MKYHLRLLIYLLLAVFSSCASLLAEGGLTLDESVLRALRNHPQLKAARLEIEIAKARLIDAGKLDNPELEILLKRSQADGDDREGSAFTGISQRFPITDRLKRAKDLRASDVELARAEIRDVERKFIDDVQARYVEGLVAKAKIDVMANLETSTAGYVTLAKKRLKTAQGSELDVASAETENILAAQAKGAASGEYREALASLRPMLGLATNARLHLSQSLDDVITSLRSSVQMKVPESLNRTDVAAAQVRRNRADAQKRLAYSERLEDWEVALGYSNQRSVDVPVGPERDHFVGIGIRIPLPFRKKGRGKMAEAQAEIKKADHLLEASRANSLAEVAVEIEAVRKTRASLNSLQDRILPLLADREKKTQKAYEQGLIDFTPVLQLQQQRARLRQAHFQAQSEHALALSRLQTALGSHPFIKSHSHSKQ